MFVVILVVCFIDFEIVMVGWLLDDVYVVGVDCLSVLFLFVVNGCVMML